MTPPMGRGVWSAEVTPCAGPAPTPCQRGVSVLFTALGGRDGGGGGRREVLCVSTAGTEQFGHSFSFQYLENS